MSTARAWVPSPKQAKLLEVAQQDGYGRTITKILEESGTNRATYYRWMERDEDFRMAWEQIWRGTIRRHLPGVVAAMVHKAVDGDVQAARLVSELAGVLMHRVRHSGGISEEDADREALEEAARLRVAEDLGVPPEEVIDELARRRRAARQTA